MNGSQRTAEEKERSIDEALVMSIRAGCKGKSVDRRATDDGASLGGQPLSATREKGVPAS